MGREQTIKITVRGEDRRKNFEIKDEPMRALSKTNTYIISAYRGVPLQKVSLCDDVDKQIREIINRVDVELKSLRNKITERLMIYGESEEFPGHNKPVQIHE